MRIILANGTIITGDGSTVLENTSVVIQDEYIVAVPRLRYVYDFEAEKVIDVHGGYVIPGIINHHTHGVSFGPLLPIARRNLPKDRVIAHLNRHLLEGTTTILNCDGFATMAEVENTNKHHPIFVRAATTHTPMNLKAAELADGSGLKPIHKETTAQEMVASGAVALGELGAGSTLGGVGSDYITIPRAIKKKSNQDITKEQARELKEAVLGKHIRKDAFDYQKVKSTLIDIGLQELAVDDARRVVEDTVLPSFNIALEGLREGGELAQKLSVPAIVHNAAASKDTVLQMARAMGPGLIAGHSNNQSFEPNEAIEVAKQLRKDRAWVDLYSAIRGEFENLDVSLRFFEEDLVDLICTDFLGGYHGPILEFIEKAVQNGTVELPKAIAMVTSNVKRAIPGLAPKRGLIRPGMVADITIANRDHLSQVENVIIGGRLAVEEGKIKAAITPSSD